MNKVVRLMEYRRKAPFVHFTRAELGQILTVYSRHVAQGEWRDYAIDHDPKQARFHIFRHAHERPLFTVEKRDGPKNRDEPVFAVYSGRNRMIQGPSLMECLAVFDK
ncbi:MAG: DUF2794 domain-containing protein [Rhodospirillaceae bacterium]